MARSICVEGRARGHGGFGPVLFQLQAIFLFQFQAIFCALFLVLLPGAALSQDAPNFEAQLASWQQTIQEAEEALEQDFERSDPAEIESALRGLVSEVEDLRSQAEENLAPLRQQLESIGPPPEEGEEAEDASIAELRRDLRSRISAGEAQATQANLMRVRALELLEKLANWQQAQRQKEILQRNPPPVTLAVWREGAEDARTLAAEVISAPIAWWRGRVEEEKSPWRGLGLFLGVPLLGFLLGWPLRRWISRRFGRDGSVSDPSYARRIVAAVADGAANAVMPAAILSLAVLVLSFYDLLTGLFATLVYAAALAAAGFLVVAGLARASLSPYLVAWRILPVQPDHVWGLLNAVRVITAVMAISLVVMVVAFTSGLLTVELEAIFFLIQTTVLSALLAWALRPGYWTSSVEVSQSASLVEEAGSAMQSEVGTAEEEGGRGWLDTARGMLRFLVVLIPFVALAGYSRLAYFLQSRLLLTAALAGFALLLRLAAHEFLERLLSSNRSYLRSFPFRARPVRGEEPREEGGDKLTLFWLGMLADVLIALPLAYILLLLYGVPGSVLQIWTLQLINGVEVGGVTISLFDIFAALIVLLVGLFLTGVFRRWLAKKVLPNTRLDAGARDSVASGAGYLGVGLALLMAVSALGVDFSNLALVAGALSVGIGFGLRTVVENFVAGLLILIERPIKVGDWIIVSGTEGTVKHISVRATEIETFDRSSVIVPNSDLVATAVTNWTHKNRMARLIIPVRAAYGSDTEKVAEVLLHCAREHPEVLETPPPSALFMGFGESSLDFQLRCFVSDTDIFLSAKSELHFAIERAFREAGIKIPFPQQEVHLRSGFREKPSDGEDAPQPHRGGTSSTRE